MRLVGVIPARFASTRFPGKPLHPIAGRPLLQWVVEQCRKSLTLHEVIVATDDERIASVARGFARVEMTRTDHASGTDRVAEVACRVPADGYINVQGDEPLMAPSVMDAVGALLTSWEMTTAATPVRNGEEYSNPNAVKVVTALDGRALYFSRRTIPFLRDRTAESPQAQLDAFPFLKHLGIYGYRRDTLLRLINFPVTPLEAAEKLEQLRALEHGIAIGVARVAHDSIGVDAPSDVARVESQLAARSGPAGGRPNHAQ
ncbi:MAG: 3-deoxy-manno-octulosonate cytidylyltransferase [Verrucomicrobiae bacterium]|nr:3-deoxy-manno-octulosonate cytidylyltransferase [Verrucomicrobiae bacterium]